MHGEPFDLSCLSICPARNYIECPPTKCVLLDREMHHTRTVARDIGPWDDDDAFIYIREGNCICGEARTVAMRLCIPHTAMTLRMWEIDRSTRHFGRLYMCVKCCARKTRLTGAGRNSLYPLLHAYCLMYSLLCHHAVHARKRRRVWRRGRWLTW